MTGASRAEDGALRAQIARGSLAERMGLLTGDVILRIGPHAPSEWLAEPKLASTLKRTDLILARRDEIFFQLTVSDGLKGASFESAPGEAAPEPIAWRRYWGCASRDGELILAPQDLAWSWALAPPLLYARFRCWPMLTTIGLVYAAGAAGGVVAFALSYLVSVAAALIGGGAMVRDALVQQGYHLRGDYRLASGFDAAAFEAATRSLWRAAAKETNGSAATP